MFVMQSDKDKANISKLIEAIKGSKGGSKIGVYSKDKFSSELIDAWRKAVREANLEAVSFSFFLLFQFCIITLLFLFSLHECHSFPVLHALMRTDCLT